MLSALRKVVGSPQTSARQPASPSSPTEGNALFEALVCDFHWTALEIGAITCCMNASLISGQTWMLRSCRNLVPIQSALVKLALSSWQNTGLPRGLASEISSLYLNLTDAKALALPLINSAGVFVEPRISLQRLEQITAVWRKLAEDCHGTVQTLEPETRWRLNGLYTANTLVLGRFLKDAIAGRRSCINQFGEVALPVLPQRRRTRRYTLLQPCKVHTRNGTIVAMARDISKIGVDLECNREFKLKDPVTLELRSGRNMKGIVVWYKTGKVGVQFDDPLADDDPLISV
jgi:hypothetical protein